MLPDLTFISTQFIVDDKWITDDSKATETDTNGIANNVLHPHDITEPPAAAAISTVGPDATTAKMVGDLPKEDSSSVPGSFPETPAADEKMSVNPIPASAGVGNPVTLAPGESVPKSITGNTIGSAVKTDKESYENADAGPASDVFKSATASVPPVGGAMIPESSLPMGAGASPFIQSSGAGSTTAAMVGNLPKEPARVPEVVSESQEAAKVPAEASANPEAVAEKKEVENELKSKVPEAPAGEGYAGAIIGTVTGAAAATAAAVTAAVYGTKDKAVDTASAATTTAKDATIGASTKAADSVPEVVKESIAEAGKAPEAASNPVAVAEKKDVEAELKKEVPVSNTAGEPAPTATAATTAKAPSQTDGPSEGPVTPKKVADKAVETPKTTTDKTVETPKTTTDKPVETPTSAATSKPTDTPTSTTDKKSKRKSIMLKFKKLLHSDKEKPSS